MKETVLSVENLWKEYRLGLTNTNTLRDDFEKYWAKLLGKKDPTLKVGKTDISRGTKGEYIWALKDINFEVKRGEVLGIIGKNGVGKSTLLKILSKITAPTKGKIYLKGRVASLLEVGTGFHPELTGRENIFLNAAILGMSKKEVKGKLEEIIDFADIFQYVDTPVKRYSSGMYVRLAFAVAAYLEPEILIVDEVLAVGDAEFQKKAIGKMNAISKGEGRTVLFVSHNMSAIRKLCSKAIFLHKGKKEFEGEVNDTMHQYLNFDRKSNLRQIDEKNRKGNGKIRVKRIYISDEKGQPSQKAFSGQYTKFIFELEKETELSGIFVFDLRFNDAFGNRLSWLSTALSYEKIRIEELEKNQLHLIIEKMPLNVGTYYLTFYCTLNEEVSDWVEDAFQFSVENGIFYESKILPRPQNGSFLIEHYFEF